eukprot:7516607-Pyramimonas_sp.AAC.1
MQGNSVLRAAASDHTDGGAEAGWRERRSKRWPSRQGGAKGQDRADGVDQPGKLSKNRVDGVDLPDRLGRSQDGTL